MKKPGKACKKTTKSQSPKSLNRGCNQKAAKAQKIVKHTVRGR